MSQLRSNKLHEQLAARLCREMVSGRLPAGAPIPSEPELVAEYGVSKTVVRETVQALAAVGVVRVQHGKRTVVLPEEEWNILSSLVQEAYRAEGLAGPLIEELYEVRIALEPQAARWTAKRARRKQREELKRIVDGMVESIGAAASGDAERFLDYDQDFHLTIAAAASNRVLRAVVRDIHELLMTSWRWTVLSAEEIEAVFDQHSAIADAIAAGDPDAAEVTMRAHLEWAARTDRFTSQKAAKAFQRIEAGRR
jgi:GntR family galactonate operon transcriptional repressor